ncbi:MAG: aldehyde ferredoxin oxidoreductase [Candidatus Lokiarchaeota archaeon]|nr:aldehyde ferredoxin oxidoreductase [Candidatus Lokiarchaeota archaeon]
MKNYGYIGKILRVNLNNKDISEESLSKDLRDDYLGGSGIGSKILYDELPEKTPPLSPENILIFMTGPLTGTNVIMTGRHTVIAKSPLTDILGYSSCGGYFGHELKCAGYDGIIIKGASEDPLFLEINNGQAEIHNATDLWGKTVSEVKKFVEHELEANYFSAIGPAGEKLINIAGIVDADFRNAGRCGLGAVMGSKKLKFIAVKGDSEPEVQDPEGIKELNKKLIKDAKQNFVKKMLLDNYKKFGTSALFGISSVIGNVGMKNWQLRMWKEYPKIQGQTLNEKYVDKTYGCYRCVIRCGRVLKDGKHGPEYETLGTLGSMCLNSDLESIIEMNNKCNDMGIDTISVGCILSFIMECSEKGLLDEKVEWGDSEKMKRLLDEICEQSTERSKLLSKGVARISQEIPNSEDFAFHVKGMEMPMHDPRTGMDLAYGTASRGADHLQGQTLTKMLPLPALNITILTSKAEYLKIQQDWNAILDSACFCKFGIEPQGPIDVVCVPEYLNLAIGSEKEYTIERLMTIGERIFNLHRLFGIREKTITTDDDKVQPRFLKKNPRYDSELREYYRKRNWDRNGIPKKSLLTTLNLV